MRLDTLLNNAAHPSPTTRKRHSYTDEELVVRISKFCHTPQMRTPIVDALGGNKLRVSTMIDKMCIDHLLKVSWKRIYTGMSARECAFYMVTT